MNERDRRMAMRQINAQWLEANEEALQNVNMLDKAKRLLREKADAEHAEHHKRYAKLDAQQR